MNFLKSDIQRDRNHKILIQLQIGLKIDLRYFFKYIVNKNRKMICRFLLGYCYMQREKSSQVSSSLTGCPIQPCAKSNQKA